MQRQHPWPYSQFLHIRRICSQLSYFDIHVIQLSYHFLRRGYPLSLLQEAALLSREHSRTDLLARSPRLLQSSLDDRVFLNTTYQPHDQSLRDIIFHNWEMLGRRPTTEFVYHKKLMVGNHRPNHLRNLLVNVKFPHLPGDEVADPTHPLQPPAFAPLPSQPYWSQSAPPSHADSTNS